jgi:nucleotide-binding universal stress UspA family protein
VLVPFDGSEGALAALDELLRIAPWFRDPPEVHLLSVYEGAPFDVEIAGMVAAGAVREHEERQLEAALAPARKRLAGTSLPVVEHTAVGPAADQIRAAGTDRCDLICMGSRGAGAIRQLVVGSTTTKVLRAVPSPVLVVSGGAHRAS